MTPEPRNESDYSQRQTMAARRVLVDTLGLGLGVVVTPASATERDGAKMLLGLVLGGFT